MNDYVKERFLLVKANRDKLASCKRHNFGSPKIESILRCRLTCLNCGGEMDFMDISKYCDGYKAAGGKVSDIIVSTFIKE